MNNKIEKATHSGKLPLGEIEIPCFVLENGKRVISGRGVTKAIGMKGRGQGIRRIPAHKTIKRFITNDLRVAIENPLQFYGTTSRKSNPTAGYEATLLHDLARAITKARDAGELRTEQEKRYGIFCEALVRAFAKVGIIALVDEVTGYQEDRERDELQRILKAYIAEELLPWTRRFPTEFYAQMFRLRDWRYPPSTDKGAPRGPRYAGRLTKELVYEKLPPGVLQELEKRNPPDEKWQRKYKHHQWLTNEIGNPHLEKHVAIVTTLMKISPNWNVFKRHFARAFPSPGDQLFLDLPESNQESIDEESELA